jgi:hypothetical protein
MGGKSAHHNKIKNMAMRLPDGRLTKNAAENISVMYPHFQRVLNNHRPTNFTILELVPQQGTMWELNDPITWDEFLKAVRKLKNEKVAGLTNVPPEAFKAMSNGNRAHVFNFINTFFKGSADYEEWHCSQCVPVPKSGDLADPNKWRGMTLMDVSSKIFSLVMNEQAFKLLDAHGTKFQFGGTPKLACRNRLSTLKTLLKVCKNHNLPTFAAFVDLVKAYNTANHALLLDVLEKYGVPPKLSLQ